MRSLNPLNPMSRLNPLSPFGRFGALNPRRMLKRDNVGRLRKAIDVTGDRFEEVMDRLEDYVERTESRRLVGVGFAMFGAGFLLGAMIAGMMGRRSEEYEEERPTRRYAGAAGGGGYIPGEPPAHGGMGGGMGGQTVSGAEGTRGTVDVHDRPEGA